SYLTCKLHLGESPCVIKGCPNQAEEGQKRCLHHVLKDRKKNARIRNSLREAACAVSNCRRPRAPNQTTCPDHLEEEVVAFIAPKFCVDKLCRNPPAENRKQCLHHLRLSKERYRSRKKKGLCKDCSSPTLSGKTRCHRHAAIRRKLEGALYRKKSYGLCSIRRCKELRLENQDTCKLHTDLSEQSMVSRDENEQISEKDARASDLKAGALKYCGGSESVEGNVESTPVKMPFELDNPGPSHNQVDSEETHMNIDDETDSIMTMDSEEDADLWGGTDMHSDAGMDIEWVDDVRSVAGPSFPPIPSPPKAAGRPPQMKR
ncbi:hypothetical protein F4805DRAFT_387892, partial [Annulohypoxylon moriforme]